MKSTPTVSESVEMECRTRKAYEVELSLRKSIHGALKDLDDFQIVLVCHELEMWVHGVESQIRENRSKS